ncbi:MAG: CPBP family intramembrane metalloprotease [Caulobacteraceae bacterium]|nr:CPBP family intramembrane metalloprotease [Caulobacteraceae bacterium]
MSMAEQSIQIDLGSRRFLHPGPWRWLRSFAWMMLLFVVVAVPAYGTISVLENLLPEETPAYLVLPHLAGAVVALGLYGLLSRFAEDRPVSEIALAPAPVGILTGLLIGAGLFALVMAIMAILGLYSFGWNGPAAVWKGLGFTIQSGVIEEVLTRAIMLRLLWRAFGPWVAFALSAAFFGAGHLGNPNATVMAAVCIALEAGIMLGAFYALTGRLWVSIGVHAGWNFAQGYLFGAAVSGGDFGPSIARSVALPGLPAWLTGGPFGPEASLPALVLCTGAGVLVLWLAARAGRFAGAKPSPRLEPAGEAVST